MNEKGLMETVLKLINSNYSNIYVIDIASDSVIKFNFSKSLELSIDDKTTFTDFIDEASSFIHEDDLNNYFNAININTLESESIKGNNETKVKYRKLLDTGEYRWFVNIINYLPFEGKKLIFMMSEDINERLTNSEENNIKLMSEVISYKHRIKKENESIGNAIYQINNLLESDATNDSISSNGTKDIINSIFNNVSLDHPELNEVIIDRMSNSTNFMKPTILIVDDSSLIRNTLKRTFNKEFNVIFASNGNEAIDIISKNVLNNSLNKEANIVGVLLDIAMPGADGFVFLDFMKKFNLFNRIPVAIISGDETKETRNKAYKYDIVDMLEKPFNTEGIRRRISKIINLYISSNNLEGLLKIKEESSNETSNLQIDNVRNVIYGIFKNVSTNQVSTKIKRMTRVLVDNLQSKYPKYCIDNKMADYIVNGAPLYNIGAIAMSNNEKLTDTAIKMEIDNGLNIIDLCIFDQEEKNIVNNIIKYSCEMYSGDGAPNRLKSDAIPIEAQIVNLVIRIYQGTKSKTMLQTIKAIVDNEAIRYNPDLIKILKVSKKELKEIK